MTRLTGVLGHEVATLEPLELGTLLPGGRSEYQQVTDALPVVDHVTATVAVSAPEATASASTTLLLLPWWVVAAVVVVLLLLVGLVVWRSRRRRPPRARQAPVADDRATVTA